jgi:NifB/MoaA-like Fe-S oxidoreductase
MSFITRIRTLTLTALTAAIVVAPGCDDGATYEALGVTVEDLEAMSAEELDALDAEMEAGEFDLAYERFVTHQPHERPEVMKELRNPLVFTHTQGLGALEGLTIRPRPTHDGEVPAPATDALAAEPDETTPCDTHGEVVEFAAE